MIASNSNPSEDKLIKNSALCFPESRYYIDIKTASLKLEGKGFIVKSSIKLNTVWVHHMILLHQDCCHFTVLSTTFLFRVVHLITLQK